MAEAALIGFGFAASYLGFALFALSQKPHHARVAAAAVHRTGVSQSAVPRTAVPPTARRRCVALGALALACSFAASLRAEGPSFGSMLWLLGLACAGIGVMLTLTYRPRWLLALQRSVARS